MAYALKVVSATDVARSWFATRHSWGDGYSVDSIKELCPNCKKEFDAFMAGARWNVIELYEFLARLRPGVYVRVFFCGEEILGGCVDEITDLKGYQHHNIMSIQQNLANTTIIEID